jgi:hypothetical protein
MLRSKFFLMSWFATTLAVGWFVWQGSSFQNSPLAITITVTLTIYTTLALMSSLAKPLPDDSIRTPIGMFIVWVLAIVVVLLFVYQVAGYYLLFGLPIIGMVVLVWLRRHAAIGELLYALGLGLMAGIAGLAAGINFVSPTVWAMIQVLLIVTGLPAGWSMLRHSGLLQAGIGTSRFVERGFISAVSGFAQGIVLCIPWALGSLVLRTTSNASWVREWWQPLTAIQPGIAEEAWGRMLLVPLVFLILRRVAQTRVAFTAAIIIVGYWFAYMHSSGGFDWFTTLMLGTLLVLPISYVCFYRDVETAIGFHFGYDFITTVALYALIR